jgi:phosphatidylinositol 4-kinase A
MKANTYKDDVAQEVSYVSWSKALVDLTQLLQPDPMKPMLDRMIDMIVASLSGSAREFYHREFAFFGEVTSISGKLKPYIKKTRPEKKVQNPLVVSSITVD